MFAKKEKSCFKTFFTLIKKKFSQKKIHIKFNNRRDRRHRVVHRIEAIENRLYSVEFLTY